MQDTIQCYLQNPGICLITFRKTHDSAILKFADLQEKTRYLLNSISQILAIIFILHGNVDGEALLQKKKT